VSDRARLPGVRGVCAALLPQEAGGPDSDELSSQVESYAKRLPPPARHGLRAGIVGLQALSLATTGRRLDRLPVDRREAVLERLAARPSTGLAIEGLKAIVLLVAGAHQRAAEMLASAAGSEPARPDGEMDVTPSSEWPGYSDADVVVVGSGAGGAMVARTLAQAGCRVVVVEEGRRWAVQEFRTRHPLDRFAELYRDAGATFALGSPPVALPIGRGVGGSTLVNSGTCYRPPEPVLDRWREDWGVKRADAATLAPYLDDVERTLQVAPVPAAVMGRNGELLLAGAAQLGWTSGPLLRNAPGCGGCCQCAIGCPRNAKLGVHLNALPQACGAGARIVSDARVTRVLVERGRTIGVELARPDGSTCVIGAPAVVVAAGTTETPPLLRRSGLGGHPQLGRNMALHPAVGTAGRFDEPVVAWHGVLQSAAVEQFHASDGILVEATSTPPGMGSMILPGHGRALVQAVAGAEHLSTLGAMVADAPSGRVHGSRRAILRYDLSRRDGDRLLRAVEIMGRLLFASGATEVLTGLPTVPVVRDEAALAAAVATGRARHLHVAAFHPTGTARMGADDQRCPVDPDGRLRGVDGVWIADGSVLPTCPEVNPQVSIMAMALAIADGMAQR
jgi:choline dehydrogenase-like flavoprotein